MERRIFPNFGISGTSVLHNCCHMKKVDVLKTQHDTAERIANTVKTTETVQPLPSRKNNWSLVATSSFCRMSFSSGFCCNNNQKDWMDHCTDKQPRNWCSNKFRKLLKRRWRKCTWQSMALATEATQIKQQENVCTNGSVSVFPHMLETHLKKLLNFSTLCSATRKPLFWMKGLQGMPTVSFVCQWFLRSQQHKILDKVRKKGSVAENRCILESAVSILKLFNKTDQCWKQEMLLFDHMDKEKHPKCAIACEICATSASHAGVKHCWNQILQNNVHNQFCDHFDTTWESPPTDAWLKKSSRQSKMKVVKKLFFCHFNMEGNGCSVFWQNHKNSRSDFDMTSTTHHFYRCKKQLSKMKKPMKEARTVGFLHKMTTFAFCWVIKEWHWFKFLLPWAQPCPPQRFKLVLGVIEHWPVAVKHVLLSLSSLECMWIHQIFLHSKAGWLTWRFQLETVAELRPNPECTLMCMNC